ncbi:MAG: DUF3696 domain-containing protein [Calothrix sp. MO_192.B10]|nr:DUF3696 domain-containing protein [Calothrix sp. MO_192.B10]
MITSLCLKNFKPFEEQLLEFRPLTLLSGLNSTGKSSVLQSLLLLRQSYQQGLLPKTGLALNGELVCIGTAQDALYEEAKEDLISFTITWKHGEESIWEFKYNREADVLDLVTQTNHESYKSSLFNDNFQYLQAERIGSRPFFEMSDFQVRQHKQLGTKGEYTAHFLSLYRDKDIPHNHLSHPTAISLSLLNQVEAWMGEISPGTRIEIRSNPDMDLVSLQYPYGLSNPRRSTNVGFGITYTLPVIVAVLASSLDTLIMVENPEAHLHPKGQAKMGELLALAASCGIQVVVETHSDHVLNGIRLAVHRGKLDHQDVQLHYFQRLEKEGKIVTEVISPRITRSGRINKWPDGFFDQMEKDLMELM